MCCERTLHLVRENAPQLRARLFITTISRLNRAIPPRRTPVKRVLRVHAPFSKGKRSATPRAPFYYDDFQSSRAIPPRRTPAKHVLRAHAPFSKGKRSATPRAPFYPDDFQSSRAIPSRRTPVKRVLRAHAPFSKGKRPRTPRAPFLPRRFPGLTAQFYQGAHQLLRVLRAHAPFSKGKRPATPRAFLSRRFPVIPRNSTKAHTRFCGCCVRTLHLVRENAP